MVILQLNGRPPKAVAVIGMLVYHPAKVPKENPIFESWWERPTRAAEVHSPPREGLLQGGVSILEEA
ncbi:hypothetical protein FRC19_010454 [Serendipita sp. 401]|nr:hypothetical protein FRC15_000853 [Serendipita sp. 397]KAG8818620.1 hypothetical protein FRC19_010454 [Serendipita sp. 401]KAG8866665.1 hypothetical protein FRC20_007871 [Serendipita sp. 405]KAG9052576.1 hypothetical protein FS842_009639 [Serendipita sp. 407]